MDVNDPTIKHFIAAALAEDVGAGDITSHAVIPEDAAFHGVMSARQDMILAGLPLALEVVRTLAPSAIVRQVASDGDRVQAGSVLALLSGPARGLLTAERTALNIVQHLSGIATLTRAYVDRIAGTGAVLLDTRKTIPGLRALAKVRNPHGWGSEPSHASGFRGADQGQPHCRVRRGQGSSGAGKTCGPVTY